MDKHTAEKLTAALLNKTIGGWLIEDYVNHGKSAVVLLASKDNQHAALKIFDPEIVDRYGREAQRRRIDRERSLIGKLHPNLIRIFDGGEDGDYLYVAMEYFRGENLAEALKEIPVPEVRPLIAQVASAAKFLEDASFAHRDIKPENIGISEDMKFVKLLDLGVIRPFDLSSITDQGDQKYFVGTLQYSPPELLFREEEHSVEGWRAITFYQLGGVLYDLLLRKPLFEAFKNPYGRLVRAVEREIPQVDAVECDPDLRLLAQNCLAKIPQQRLDTVKWEHFSQPKVIDPMEAARRRIAQHRLAVAQAAEVPTSAEDMRNAQIFTLRTAMHSAVVNTIKMESLPRYSTQVILEPHPFLLRVLFEPSTKSGLRCHFAVYCLGTVLDPQASLHELRVCACASVTRKAVPAEPDANAPSLTVKGALIDQDVRPHIQQCLLLAYAEALDNPPTSPEEVRWMKLGGQS
jgi:serine/threonine protein kinase